MLRSATQDRQGTAPARGDDHQQHDRRGRRHVAAGLLRPGRRATGDRRPDGPQHQQQQLQRDRRPGRRRSLHRQRQLAATRQIYLPGYAGPATPFTELSTYPDAAPRAILFSAGPTESGTGGAYNPTATITGQAFVLPVPAMVAQPGDVASAGRISRSARSPRRRAIRIRSPPRTRRATSAGDMGAGGKAVADAGDSGGSDGGSGTDHAAAAGDDAILTVAELEPARRRGDPALDRRRRDRRAGRRDARGPVRDRRHGRNLCRRLHPWRDQHRQRRRRLWLVRRYDPGRGQRVRRLRHPADRRRRRRGRGQARPAHRADARARPPDRPRRRIWRLRQPAT